MEGVKQGGNMMRSEFGEDHPGSCGESIPEGREARCRQARWETREVSSLNGAVDKDALLNESLGLGIN